MNLYLRFSSIVILFFAIIISCKKSSDEVPRDPDKLRITRIIQSTVREPQKVNVTDFIYDDRQRVKRIAFSSGELVYGNLSLEPGHNLSFYYYDTDKNPYRASGRVSGGWIADIFYTYNNTGKLIRDSAIGAGINEVKIHDYTYSPDKLIIKKRYYFLSSPGGIIGNTLTDSVVIRDNNIAEIVYTTGSIGQPAYYYLVSYDDKINPMSKLNIASVKVTEGLNGFPDNMGPGFCKNNIKSYATGTISYSGDRSEKATQPYVYTYTNEGLPQTCTVITPLETYTFKYTYEELFK